MKLAILFESLKRPSMSVFVAGTLLALLGYSASQSAPAQKPNENSLRVFLLDAKQLESTKRRIRAGDQSLVQAVVQLDRDAQKALTTGPFSVVTKDSVPPSGEKHDYLSQAPYFWPDSSKPNGLPYLRRDGERNPEINKISDHRSLDQMINAVETLSLAYYYKGNDAYAARAVQLLHAFFLDPATRMNPHLQFAQFIPGVNTGRG